jgi:hypothetical protein
VVRMVFGDAAARDCFEFLVFRRGAHNERGVELPMVSFLTSSTSTSSSGSMWAPRKS